MTSSAFYLSCSVDSDTLAQDERIDLSTRSGRRYVLPHVIREYAGNVEFKLRAADGAAFSVENATPGLRRQHLSQREVVFRLARDAGEKGRHGYQREACEVVHNGARYPFRITFPFRSEHLEQEQYEMMLDDLVHWVHLELQSGVKHAVRVGKEQSKAVRPHLATYELLKRRIDELEFILQRISKAPKNKIEKAYSKTRQYARRQDAHTVRWNALNEDVPDELTFEHVASSDVYENRFILFVLSYLERLLRPLERVLQKTVDSLSTEANRVRRLYARGGREKHQLDKAERALQNASQFRRSIDDLRQRLRRMKRYPFLRDVSYNPALFELNFSLALTQEIDYSKVFALFREFRDDAHLRRLEQCRQFTSGVVTLGAKRTWQVYEYWTFFAVYQALMRCGFQRRDGDGGILEMISSDMLVPGLIPGRSVTLVGSGRLEHVSVRLIYEQEHVRPGRMRKKDENPDACPDVTVEVSANGYVVARFMLDAKYKSYTGATASDWTDDIEQVQKKYQAPGIGRIGKSCGAFLMHVNPKKKEYNRVALRRGDVVWYGHIPVMPDKTDALEILLEDVLDKRLEGELRT